MRRASILQFAGASFPRGRATLVRLSRVNTIFLLIHFAERMSAKHFEEAEFALHRRVVNLEQESRPTGRFIVRRAGNRAT